MGKSKGVGQLEAMEKKVMSKGIGKQGDWRGRVGEVGSLGGVERRRKNCIKRERKGNWERNSDRRDCGEYSHLRKSGERG